MHKDRRLIKPCPGLEIRCDEKQEEQLRLSVAVKEQTFVAEALVFIAAMRN